MSPDGVCHFIVQKAEILRLPKAHGRNRLVALRMIKDVIIHKELHLRYAICVSLRTPDSEQPGPAKSSESHYRCDS